MTGDWSKCCPNGALRPSEWPRPIPAIGTYRRWFVRSRIFASSTSSASRLHETGTRVIYADALVPAGTPGPIIDQERNRQVHQDRQSRRDQGRVAASYSFVGEVPADWVSRATIRGCDAASHSFMQIWRSDR